MVYRIVAHVTRHGRPVPQADSRTHADLLVEPVVLDRRFGNDLEAAEAMRRAYQGPDRDGWGLAWEIEECRH